MAGFCLNMKIKDIGGEFGLINRIKKSVRLFSSDVVAGIGDDAAVLKHSNAHYLLFTTDALVENVHFSLKYFTPEQIGMKSVEQNVSDIAAMGGLPKYLILSLMLPKGIEVDIVDRIICGINKKCKLRKIDFVGGNTSASKEIIISMAMLGFVEKKHLALRSRAKINDLVFCSGDAGKSSVGLELLRHNLKGESIKKHLEPQSRLDLSRKLVGIGINSMIDVSDGVASEVSHIYEESKVGAVICADKIPISKNMVQDAKKLGKNPLDFALYGGEDFELVFTANKNKLRQLRKFDVSVIGKIVDKKYGIKLVKGGKSLKLKNGFEHFR